MTTTESAATETAPPPKHNVSVDDLYRRSTQYKFWSYTPETLSTIRQNINEEGQMGARKKFAETYESIKQQNLELFAAEQAELDEDKLVDLITLEEELKYLNFYGKNIIQAANFFKMPTQVKATAISFFKKFYLQNSVMQFHPKNVLYTCLFLAAKSENYFISIDSFCKALQNTEPKHILDLEFTVLLSLKFTLLVHHPFRPLYGFFLDFQEALLIPEPALANLNIDKLGQMYDKAKKWLNDYALLSDVSFHFTPPQIALAAMYDTDTTVTETYLKRKFQSPKLETVDEQPELEEPHEEPKTQNPDQYTLILESIVECIKIAKEKSDTSREESTKIDRKCYFAIHPDKLLNKKIKKLKSSSIPPAETA